MALPSEPTAAQKLAVGQDTQLMKLGGQREPQRLFWVSWIGCKVDHAVPFQSSHLPCWSTAMQKLIDGHDTAANEFVSIDCGAENLEPFQTSAPPASSTAMQKLADGHEMEASA